MNGHAYSALRAAILLIGVCAAAGKSGTARAGEWVAAWYSPPFPTTPAWTCGQVRMLAHQSVRQVIRLEVGGDRIRVRLTNELGLLPVRVGDARVARSSPNGVLEAGTGHVLTFGGRRDVVIPSGKALISDPIDMKVARFDELAISIYYPGVVAPAGHLDGLRISSSGDHTAGEAWALGSSAEAPALASRVDAEVASPHPVLVAFGDSITEGRWTSDIHDDYPEQLAGLLAADSAAAQWVVINSGIGGNRLLQDGDGPSALARFGRDALDIPGVKAIVLLEGINDIGVAYMPSSDTGPVRAAAIIGAYRDLIRRAHARGLKIYLATLTPYMGASYERPAGEKVREEVNAWIRKGHGFDGVIDFDAALRDPAHPLSLIGADQLGDDLHPNDSGYGIMAKTVLRQVFGSGVRQEPVCGGTEPSCVD
jgi:lysophospholipase L1-like esterase